MSKPSVFNSIGDGIFVSLNGAVRVRVWMADGKPQAIVRGKAIGKISPERFRDAVLELKPAADGVVDFTRDEGRNWTLRVRGKLCDDNFEQRLRNVVVNSLV